MRPTTLLSCKFQLHLHFMNLKKLCVLLAPVYSTCIELEFNEVAAVVLVAYAARVNFPAFS